MQPEVRRCFERPETVFQSPCGEIGECNDNADAVFRAGIQSFNPLAGK